MNLRNVLSSRSSKDFFSLFFSNILQKICGLVREPVIAYFFGTSILYANYLVLRTVANFFSQFTVGNALKANLLPKFTKIYESHKIVSLKTVFTFSNKVMITLFLISQILQTSIILYLDSDYVFELVIISLLLSISICFNFFNMVYLTIMQAQGKFFKYSIATSLNSIIVAIFIYPLTYFIGIFGLVVSRLLGIITLTVSYIIPMNKSNNGYEVSFSRNDLSVPILVLGNFANIIIVSSQFLSGLDGSRNIAYFNYSIFILNAVMTSIIGNISTLLLRNVSITKDKSFMYFSLSVSLVVGIGLVFMLEFIGYDLIKLFFYRGAFTLDDVRNTTIFIQELSYSFILIFIANTLLQPFFSLCTSKTKRQLNIMCWIFLLLIFGGILSLHYIDIIDSKMKSLILIYSSSFISVLLSIYSYLKYLEIEK